MPRAIGSRRLPHSGPATTGHKLLTEPCLNCGEDTVIGTIFFSDRSTIDLGAGQSAFLCSLCDSGLRASHKGQPLPREEVRNLIKNGAAVALGWRP
jgi:hypothetical protein